MRYFADLSYCGALYHGWQVQPNGVSVQEVVESALGKIAGAPVAVTGAGRTDAGVNAYRMIAHFDWPDIRPFDEKRVLAALNSLCGPDIAFYSIREVPADAHARFDATSRTYRYFATERKDPFMGKMAWKAPAGLNFGLMNEAAKHILGRQDFTSFSKLHSAAKTNICTVSKAEWRPVEGGMWSGAWSGAWGGGFQPPENPRLPAMWMFEITADRFLRNMVRAVVGTLVEVGKGNRPPEWVADVIAMKDRCEAGTSMPGKALFLYDITYPSEIYTPPER